MVKHVTPPLEEIKTNRRPIRNINVERREKLSQLDKLAMNITAKVGTMGFFLIVFTWTFLWLGWNLTAPVDLRFDPYPAFVLWLCISNMIQIMLMPLLLVGQNLQGRHSEARAEADYEVNTEAEREIEIILEHLENQNELILKILEKLDHTKTKK